LSGAFRVFFPNSISLTCLKSHPAQPRNDFFNIPAFFFPRLGNLVLPLVTKLHPRAVIILSIT